MLGTFIDKATGILDRQFLIAYWFPVFMVQSIAVLIRVYVYGLKASIGWWRQDWLLKDLGGGIFTQIWVIVGYLIVITTFAYLLQPFTRPIIRLYEGYWPLTLRNWFTNLPIIGEKKRKEMLKQKNKSALFYEYPREKERVMPTKMGNAMRAAEDYSETVCGMNSVYWWPRLWFLLPDLVRNEVNNSLVPVVALLNFTSLIMIEAIIGSSYLKYEGFSWQSWTVLLVGFTLLALLSYWAAVKQAIIYGNKTRAAIDLYRFELLKAMHLQLPDTLMDESYLWCKLEDWTFKPDPQAVKFMKYKHN